MATPPGAENITVLDIVNNFTYLLEELNAKQVADALYSEWQISSLQLRQICEESTRQDACRRLLRCIIDGDDADSKSAMNNTGERRAQDVQANVRVTSLIKILSASGARDIVTEIERRRRQRMEPTHVSYSVQVTDMSEYSDEEEVTTAKTVSRPVATIENNRSVEENTWPAPTRHNRKEPHHQSDSHTKVCFPVLRMPEVSPRRLDETSWPSPMDISPEPGQEDRCLRTLCSESSLSNVALDKSSCQTPSPFACLPYVRRTSKCDTAQIRKLTQSLEHMQDNWEWQRFEYYTDRILSNNEIPVELAAALLQLQVRQQCFQKAVNYGTIDRCDKIMAKVRNSNNASFLEAEILSVKAWACWLIGNLGDAARCLSDAMTIIDVLRPGKEAGLVHYHLAFYLRFKYCLQQDEADLLIEDTLWQKIKWHYHQAVMYFEKENTGEGGCSSLLIYSRLSLAQCALKTGVTISCDDWKVDKLTERDLHMAKNQLEIIETSLWQHVQPFTKLCFFMCKADLFYIQGQFSFAYDILERVHNINNEFKFGLPEMEKALAERLFLFRKSAEGERRLAIEIPSIADIIQQYE